MRKIFSKSLIVIAMLLGGKSAAQDLSISNDQSNDVFVAVEIAADFPGSIYSFRNFVKSNFEIPKKAVRKKVKGEIPVQFIVEKDGSLSDIKVLTDLGFGLNEEVIRVFKLSPKWKPASFNGKKSKSLITFKIYIDTENEKDKRIYFEKK